MIRRVAGVRGSTTKQYDFNNMSMTEIIEAARREAIRQLKEEGDDEKQQTRSSLIRRIW